MSVELNEMWGGNRLVIMHYNVVSTYICLADTTYTNKGKKENYALIQ